jgi:chemosensory pili system protein ChpA (sensor histidine kinase/response regulator)
MQTDIQTEFLQEFINEVQSYMPTIRGGILICAQNGNHNGELDTPLKQLQTIKGAAAMIELEDIEKITSEMSDRLSVFSATKEPLDDSQARYLLDKLAELESSVTKISFSIDEFPSDVSDFVNDSFDVLQGNEAEVNAAEMENEEDSFEEFEIDEEMLEIFGIEAEDLLRNINVNLEILEKLPNNREALLEIRRNAHTLKGSAGIVGLKRLSKVAHHVEDLLDYLSENEIESNERIFHLLLSATDCLSALASGDTSDSLKGKVNRLLDDFEQITTWLQSDEEKAAAAAAAMQNPANDHSNGKMDESNEGNQSPKTQQHRPVVRISLDKLDDLVKVVSGLVINRSVFEQRLSELEQQIAELHNSTRRLQRSTTKLETEFEADMLGNNGFRQTEVHFADEASSNGNLLEFDTLEFDNYTEFHQTTRELIETTQDTASINTKLDSLRSNLEILFDSQRRLVDEMQDKLLRLRMVKFGSLFTRLQRTVRVTSEEELKTVELKMEGENLEVDTQILDSLIEPLLHLLRNAIAHGIESPETRRLLAKPEKGKISLRATSEGTHIVLTVSDDGRGISASTLKEKAVQNGFLTYQDAENMSDDDALQLIFLPGLTTAEQINHVSGRGVGMNIVKTQVLRQQGTISIDTETQKGSTFTIRLPMALAVTRALLVKSIEQTYAFPLKLVKHISEIPGVHVEKARQQKSLRLGDKSYKLVHLNELLGMPTVPFGKEENIPLLLIDSSEGSFALIVDKILKPEEIVIKPLGSPLESSGELLGASILGDGKIVPVLDLLYLLQNKQANPVTPVAQPKIEVKTDIMIVDDSPSVRHMTSKIIKNVEWNPVVAKDGIEALEILQNSRELPKAILTDVEMPRMDGYELLASLKREEKLKHIPVIMITSRAGDKHRQKAKDLGVSGYLVKPFKDSALIDMVKDLAKIEN